ncbi:MAG: FkbM family methyltransferase, partial [Sedimentisphaerales bacterium]
MAKKRKKNKFRRTQKVNFPVKNSNQRKSLSYNDWKPNTPIWLKEIQTSIDQGDIRAAKKLLAEEELQKKLAGLSNIYDIYFSKYEIALQLVRSFQGQRALQYCFDALKLGESVEIYNGISLIYDRLGKCSLAIENLYKAKQLEPNNIAIWNNLGCCFMKVGRAQEAIDLFRKAVAINPNYHDAYSNLLLNLNYLPEVEVAEIFEESKKMAQIQMPPALACKKYNNFPDPDKKLRIGYISSDFKVHSVMYFFESLLMGHDRNNFEIYGYGDVTNPDEHTGKLIEKFDIYRNITSVDNIDAVKLIKSDSIDILVDLSGHTGRNRLGVLAYKPAPIQVTYLGYPNTTGMSQVDYRFTDAVADTPDQQQYYTEKLVFLPNGFLCYNPGDIQPPIKNLPSLKRGYTLFSCFNTPKKINHTIVKIWIDVLKNVPNSKLLLKFKDGEDEQIKEYLWNLFAEHGLKDPKKDVMIFGAIPYEAHLDTYNSIDIALDTYPYNGTTTTCQAIFMGVPVITLTGKNHASRVGLDILSRLDMQFFSAQSSEEYVKKAVVLASKPEALAKIRTFMRQRLAASPLCNYGLITSDIENAYRKMWQDYCCSKTTETQPHEDAAYKTRRYSNRTIIDNIISADKFYQAGERAKALKYAAKAFDELPPDNNGEKPPRQLLERYNADDLQLLVINFCMETIAFSSYFSRDNYYRIYAKAQEINLSNPEINLRIGLLMALEARLKNVKIQELCIKLLEIADSKLNNERSKAVLALAKGDLKELSLPYDLARIHLCPDLKNITTYVLLEQGDWFEKSDLNFFRSIIRPDDTVLDLGANVGVYSLSAAARTNGKVIAVEPARQTFELLNKSASQFSNMTAIHTAISDKPGTAFLSHGG